MWDMTTRWSYTSSPVVTDPIDHVIERLWRLEIKIEIKTYQGQAISKHLGGQNRIRTHERLDRNNDWHNTEIKCKKKKENCYTLSGVTREKTTIIIEMILFVWWSWMSHIGRQINDKVSFNLLNDIYISIVQYLIRNKFNTISQVRKNMIIR